MIIFCLDIFLLFVLAKKTIVFEQVCKNCLYHFYILPRLKFVRFRVFFTDIYVILVIDVFLMYQKINLKM